MIKVRWEGTDGDAAGAETNPSKQLASWAELLGRSQIPQGLPLNLPTLLPLTSYLPNAKGEACSGSKHPQPHSAPHRCNQHYLWQPASSNLQLQMDQPALKAPTDGIWT